MRVGGGVNHRMGLGDAALIKDNHVAAAGSVVAALRAVREAAPDLPCEVEVDSLEQLDEVLAENVELVLLDNFPVWQTQIAAQRRDVEDLVERPVDQLAHVHADQPQHGMDGGHVLDPQQHRLARVGGVLLDDPVEVGIGVRQRGHHHRRQARVEAAVQSAERVAEVADGRPEDRADDVQLRRVRAADLGGPRGGQAAAGVAPQPDRCRRRQVQLL